MIKGIIVKALSGFYYVKTENDIIECKARGAFRKKEFAPLVGDNVEISITDENRGVIEKITPRLNCLIRPPVANIDRLFIVVSTVSPAPNNFVIDKMTVLAQHNNIEPIIVINKSDLSDPSAIAETYRKCGFKVYIVSAEKKEGIEELYPLFKDKLVCFCGNSGVGKSSLLNAIDSRFDISTSHISEKLGRGRHTTRHVELYEAHGGLIADTPGFSSIDMERTAIIKKDELQYCFLEFEDYLGECKFTSCSHTKEKSCAVLEAVENGIIPESRIESYRRLYEEASKYKEWELN
ncbi:MAG: ribosome small subunit-dependent GTPase A [Clostridia bacterium]|nr:ribosome small subunit-dependent GTPase A [Clostridia bacterium]